MNPNADPEFKKITEEYPGSQTFQLMYTML